MVSHAFPSRLCIRYLHINHSYARSMLSLGKHHDDVFGVVMCSARTGQGHIPESPEGHHNNPSHPQAAALPESAPEEEERPGSAGCPSVKPCSAAAAL